MSTVVQETNQTCNKNTPDRKKGSLDKRIRHRKIRDEVRDTTTRKSFPEKRDVHELWRRRRRRRRGGGALLCPT